MFNLRKVRRTSEERPAPALLAQGLRLTKRDCQMEEFCLCVNDSAIILYTVSLTVFKDSFLLNGAITWTLTESSNSHQLRYQGASLPYPTAPGSHPHPFDAVKNHLGVWSCSRGPLQGSLPPPRIRSPDHMSVLSWTWGRKSLCYMDLQVYELVFSLIALRNIGFIFKCKGGPP